MKRIALTSCTCDNRYVDVFKVFLVSMRENNGCDLLIRADLYNGTIGVYDGYKKIYPNLEIHHIEIPAKDWEKDQNLLQIMYPRIKQIHGVMLEGYDQIMLIDCDTIIRKSIDHIWDGLIPGTIKIWDRGERKNGKAGRFQAGVHLYGNSKEIQDYYTDWIKDIGETFAFLDGQKQMYFTYLKHKEKVALLKLDPKYNDLHFGKDSYIWHARHTHLDEEPFKTEFNYYLGKANELC